MCGRYAIYQTGELKSRFDLITSDSDEVLKSLSASYNVAPGQNLPIITQSAKRRIDLMRWGLIPAWAEDPSIGYRFINARAESLLEKPLWKSLARHSRCLVPANGFYEWRAAGNGKQPFFIRPEDQSLFAFAGLTSSWTDKRTGEIVNSYSIITTTPNKQMRRIHDRMPVILKPDGESRWLDPSPLEPGSFAELLRPYEEGKLEIYPVSQDVNSARLDDEHLIYPIRRSDT